MTAPDRAAVTPAELELMAAVANAPVIVTVSERLGAGRSALWRVAVDPVGPFQLDGRSSCDLPEDDVDYDADSIHGYGSTREEAIADALRMLRRVTWAHVTVMDWDVDTDSLVLRAVVLTVMPDGCLTVMSECSTRPGST